MAYALSALKFYCSGIFLISFLTSAVELDNILRPCDIHVVISNFNAAIFIACLQLHVLVFQTSASDPSFSSISL